MFVLGSEAIGRAEAEAIDVARALEQTRAEWAWDWSNSWFYVRLQGGGWTHQFAGDVSDSAVCFARAEARHWCGVYQWPKQRGFRYRTHGVEPSVMLAREWAHTGNHFYSIWRDAGRHDGYRFSDEELQSYASMLEWVEWTRALPPDAAVWCKIREVEGAAPANPL